MAVVIIIEALNPADGERVTLRLAAGDDKRITGLDTEIWWPGIVKLPTLAMEGWDGDFTTAVQAAAAAIQVDPVALKKADPLAPSYRWSGAPLRIYEGDPDDAFDDWTIRFVGLIDDYGTDETGRYSFTARVDSEPFEVMVPNQFYAGTGEEEGHEDLKGKVKPLTIGRCRNIEPIMIDIVNNVFQYHGYGETDEVVAVYENAASFTENGGTNVGDFADYDALVAATIPEGDFGTALAVGMFRLGAPPAGVITADVNGDSVALGWRTADVILLLCIIGGVPSERMHAASFTAFHDASTANINLYLTSQVKLIDQVQALAQPVNTQAMISWLGLLQFCRFTAIGTPTHVYDGQGRNLPALLSVQEIKTSPPYWRIEMLADKANRSIAGPGGTGGDVDFTGSGGLKYWDEARSLTSPNDTIGATSWTPKTPLGFGDVAAIVRPIGDGYIAAAVPDGTALGGNIRGLQAVDWQLARDNADEVASGLHSVIVGGSSNKAPGDHAIAGGESNAATGVNSVALGKNATTRGIVLADAFGGGSFDAPGDAQRGTYILRCETDDDTPTVMTANALSAGAATLIVLPNHSTYLFKASIVARRADANNESAAYTFEGCIDRNGGAAFTALVGVPAKTVLAEDSPDWDVAASADTTNGALTITVTGEADKTIRWVAKVETVEVVIEAGGGGGECVETYPYEQYFDDPVGNVLTDFTSPDGRYYGLNDGSSTAVWDLTDRSLVHSTGSGVVNAISNDGTLYGVNSGQLFEWTDFGDGTYTEIADMAAEGFIGSSCYCMILASTGGEDVLAIIPFYDDPSDTDFLVFTYNLTTTTLTAHSSATAAGAIWIPRWIFQDGAGDIFFAGSPIGIDLDISSVYLWRPLDADIDLVTGLPNLPDEGGGFYYSAFVQGFVSDGLFVMAWGTANSGGFQHLVQIDMATMTVGDTRTLTGFIPSLETRVNPRLAEVDAESFIISHDSTSARSLSKISAADLTTITSYDLDDWSVPDDSEEYVRYNWSINALYCQGPSGDSYSWRFFSCPPETAP